MLLPAFAVAASAGLRLIADLLTGLPALRAFLDEAAGLALRPLLIPALRPADAADPERCVPLPLELALCRDALWDALLL